MNCSSSFDPAAINATLLYNQHEDKTNLWTRQNQAVPLPNCSSTAPPPESNCTVCVDRLVYAVCRKLANGVKLVMERDGHEVVISKSGCPKLLSDDTVTDAPQWLLPVVVILTLVVIAVIIAVVYKCCKRSTYLRGSKIPTQEENRPSDL